MPNPNEGSLLIEAHPITARSTVRAALRLMDTKHAHVLPVIDDYSGQAVGIVLRQALERGCLKMGHDPDECVIAHHTLRDVLDATDVRPRGRSSRAAAMQYRIVLDGAGYPMAILKNF
jgi:CBS domain-containing protein